MECYKDKVFLNRNRLTITNKLYTVDNLCTLPENIHPKTSSTKSNESALFQSILRAKFEQDLNSNNYLVNTGAKTLAEASLRV